MRGNCNKGNKDGFTLIELMIVIAIIAIIAAIAIPGLLSSQRASNERNASASLKTVASAQADFRGNDRDGNKIQDFWTLDVSGLYGVIPADSTEMIKLIEVSVAGADFYSGAATGPNAALGATGVTEVAASLYAIPAPKAGFWYRAMFSDENATALAYALDTNGVMDSAGTSATGNLWWNHSKFAVLAFPDSFSAGRSVFFLNEGNTIYKRGCNATVRPTGTPPVATALVAGSTGVIGTQAVDIWPNDTVSKNQYSKLD